MQIIPMPAKVAPDLDPSWQAQDALAGVVGAMGDPRFGTEALAQLNRWMPLCWWSVYQLFSDQPPAMHLSGSHGVEDGTHASWKAYRTSLYRRDATFAMAHEALRDCQPLLMHWHAHEFSTAHREQIYTRHGLRERVSIVSSQGDSGALLAVNFYRHEAQPQFQDEELDALGRSARLLLACVRQHLGSHRRDVLNELTLREREVCERMLKGWTHEGIAADLGVSASTVKTYRDRAFERLGVHHRNELFALVSGRLG
ncbi:helix-turn-helix transcriptional regulator [Sphaerotilus sp.]|uniref:helix-turn-helix transcriptional regulator n=1 Tax=Sphaerotilus sp. TaxID=2093942 RepID=UPI00286DDAF4|nr:helix-turn-helix transcriptional regulator [Sphaerotilus sp.]